MSMRIGLKIRYSQNRTSLVLAEMHISLAEQCDAGFKCCCGSTSRYARQNPLTKGLRETAHAPALQNLNLVATLG